jgi:hypothetical protein
MSQCRSGRRTGWDASVPGSRGRPDQPTGSVGALTVPSFSGASRALNLAGPDLEHWDGAQLGGRRRPADPEYALDPTAMWVSTGYPS